MTVKINETPSQQVLAKSQAEFTAKDSTGRVFTIRKPAFLAQFRLVETAGESAESDRYMSMISPLIYIVAIDNDPVLAPTTKLELEALIQRVGDHGYETVMECLAKNFSKKNPEEEKAALKK